MSVNEGELGPRDRAALASLRQGALVIALFALAFLARPIVQFGEGYFSPADIGQLYTLTRTESGVQPGNTNLSDVFCQMHPWMMFNKEALSQGRLPVWNPWNGGGVPHLANYQSSVFSIFSLPYYLLPSFKLAILVAAFLKLFALGFGTFLFLRELRLKFVATCFGAVSYMFAAHNVILLGFPHSGVAALLPWSLFVFERIASRVQSAISRGERAVLWRVPFPKLFGCFALVLGLGVLAGHPETLYFALLGLVIYAVWRSFGLVRGAKGARGTLAIWGVQLALAGVFAAGFGAIQLVPFFEYLQQSGMLEYRSSGPQTPLELQNWSLQVFPGLLGTPGRNYFLCDELPSPNFTTTTMSYVGGVTLFLAVVSILFVRRSNVLRFFLVLCGVWIFYAFDIWGSSELLQKIPSLHVAPINRSQPLWVLGTSACAAFGLHYLLGLRRSIATSIALIAGGIVFIGVFRIGAARLIEVASRTVPDFVDPSRIPFAAPTRIEAGTLIVLAAVGLLALLAVVRQGRARMWVTRLLVLVGAGQSGAEFFFYNPVTPDRYFYRSGDNLAKLRSKIGNEDFVAFGNDVIPPPSNVAYGVRQIAVYDALGIGRYEKLYRQNFGETNNWCMIFSASSKALQLFGVSWVLAQDRWFDVDNPFSGLSADRSRAFESPELVAGRDLVQDFAGLANRLDTIRIPFVTRGRSNTFSFDVSIEDGETGEILATKHVEPDKVRPDSGPVTRWIFSFDPIENSQARHLRLRIHSDDAESSATWTVQCNSDMRWWLNVATWRQLGKNEPPNGKYHESMQHWQAHAGDVAIDGNMHLDFSHGWSTFEPVARVETLILHRFERACGRFFTVGSALASRGLWDSWAAIVNRDLDPREIVVLEGVDAASLPRGEREDAPVEVLDESASGFRLRTQRNTPGWLVMAQPWYPGWIARVNGVESPILRANYAFRAVALGPGTSEVEFEYRPLSVKIGAWTSLASIALFSAWIGFSSRGKRSII